MPQPSPGHFALEVDDFGAVYRWATAPACSHALPTALRSSSSRAASARCTSTTRAATSSRSATRTPARWREQIPEMVRLADLYPQNADADRATLFLDR